MNKLFLIFILFFTLNVFAGDTNSSTQILPHSEPGLVLITKSEHEDNRQLHYRIALNYPEIQVSKGFPHQNFNRHILKTIKKITRQFIKNVHSASRSIDRSSTLTIKYTVTNLNNHFLSVRFSVDSYIRGSAYPNENYIVFNYDLKKSAFIKFSSLFKPHSNYLKFLNNYCVEKLVQSTQMDPTTLIKQKFLNYDEWNIQPTGILLTFDDFPHVIGVHTILIPYELLANYLNPAFKNEVVNIKNFAKKE